MNQNSFEQLQSSLPLTDEPIDFSPYPPSPIIWTYNVIDTICDPIGCSHWRDYLPDTWTQDTAWLSPKNKLSISVFTILPNMMTYNEFLETTRPSNEQQQQQPTIQSLSKYIFETPSTSLADLTTIPSILMLTMLVLLLRQIKSLTIPFFSRLGKEAARHTHGPNWHVHNEIRIIKFGEYVFRLWFHFIISVIGVWLFYNKPWWSNVPLFWTTPIINSNNQITGTKTLWWNFPYQPVDPDMVWYYLIQAAYNIEAMVCLLELSMNVRFQSIRVPIQQEQQQDDKNNNNENGTSQYQSTSASSSYQYQFPITWEWSKTVRGDFREMLIHHIVTNLLVIGSSFFRFTRVGSMVFLIHDISDVPVDLSKLANFLKWKTSTAICFASMVLIWLITRLYILPFVIYRSVLFESYLICSNGYIPPIYHVTYKPMFVILIGLLILLHFIWFTMFIRMGYVLVSKGEAHDLSEHKKGEHLGVGGTNKMTITQTSAAVDATVSPLKGSASSNGSISSMNNNASNGGHKKDN